MRKIPLRARDGTVRAYALVDDEDFEWLSQWRWHLTPKGYAARSENLGKPPGSPSSARNYRVRTYRMHRQIMGFPASGVDHWNRNSLDNRRRNLRVASQGQNMQNQRRVKNTRSGVRGVTWCGGKWVARAMLDGKSHYLGGHDTIEGADAAVTAFRGERMPYSQEAAA